MRGRGGPVPDETWRDPRRTPDLGLLIGDLLMALLDPRINLAQKGATR